MQLTVASWCHSAIMQGLKLNMRDSISPQTLSVFTSLIFDFMLV